MSDTYTIPNRPGFEGQTLAAGSVYGATVPRSNPYAAAQPQLPFQFCDYRTIPFGAWGVPWNNDVACPAGTCAWFGLESVTAATFGADFFWFGYSLNLKSPDVAGSGSQVVGLPVAWGDLKGQTAFIVMGVGLPVRKGAWSIGPAIAPGMSDTASLRTSGLPPRPWRVVGFPAGKFGAVADVPPELRETDSKLPTMIRVTGNRALSAALVVNPANLAAGPGSLAGYMFGEFNCGLTDQSAGFGD